MNTFKQMRQSLADKKQELINFGYRLVFLNVDSDSVYFHSEEEARAASNSYYSEGIITAVKSPLYG